MALVHPDLGATEVHAVAMGGRLVALQLQADQPVQWGFPGSPQGGAADEIALLALERYAAADALRRG